MATNDAAERASDDVAEGPEIDDFDRDSLHTLSLSIIPFKSPSLRKARLLKNQRLETMIEVFKSDNGGSGQMEVEVAAKEFGWDARSTASDLTILRQLASLPSYDVYTVRIALRHLGVNVDDVAALKLSDAKVHELTDYMKAFTHPLVMGIYGGDDVEIKDFHDVIQMFTHPDKAKAAEKLKIMADRLELHLEDLPAFLEDFGDIFLSLSYYRHALDEIHPTIRDILLSIRDIQENQQLSADPMLMKTCRLVQQSIRRLLHSVTERMDHFDEFTQDMWKNISADRFRKIEDLVRNYQTIIGGSLCALTLKIEGWKKLFPTSKTGGPMRRAEYIMSDLRQGMENIEELEENAHRFRKT